MEVHKTVTPLDRHANAVMQFSGGKDSIACLVLLRPYLDRITVVWTNTGAAFPETLAQMERVRAMCPNFVEVRGNQPAQVSSNGFPVDVLPIRNHPHVQFLAGQSRPPMQSFLDCCMANMMAPMHEATLAMGATLIIRGQKQSDDHKSPVKSGDVINGVEYWFPIEAWNDDDVMALVGGNDLLPAHYADARTSLDCWSCTAYLADNQWKLPYLTKHHPEKAQEVRRRLILIRDETRQDVRHLDNILLATWDK